MLAVTKPVQAALARCDAWQLRLDKFSFQRDGDAAAKTASLKAIRECYTLRSSGHLAGVCRSRQRLLDVLKHQHGPRFVTIDLVLESKLLLRRPNNRLAVGSWHRIEGRPQHLGLLGGQPTV
jgi:hypothetical protein